MISDLAWVNGKER